MNTSVLKTISHYNILEELGRGGMGVIYKAEDTKLRRTVALKFLPAHVAVSEKDKQRFIQEAQSASALNHPNVCTIHDIQEISSPETSDGPAGKQLFIVMEYVEGRTVRQMLNAQNPNVLPIKQVVDVGIQVADGLAAAHEKGIVHRDIKPENIMVRKDGIVQIMDFGVAMLRNSEAPRLTQQGAIVGTVGYMSPEQVQSLDTDHRSDIFSLGVLLFEMFTGQLPFKGLHDAALMYEIVNVTPQGVSRVRPDVDGEIDRIVMECLQKDPADRFQSAAEVAKELRRVRRAEERSRTGPVLPPGKGEGGAEALVPQSAPRSGGRWRVRLSFAALAVVMCIAGLLLWRPWEATDPRHQPVERFVLTMPRGCSLEPRQDGLALSPDGRHLALVARQDSVTRLFLRDMDQFDMRPLDATSGLNPSGVFFSPDGQWLGFFANEKLMKVSLRGGTPVTICDGASMGGQASWGEGGSIVFTKDWGSCLWIVSSEVGSAPRPLTRIDTQAGERAHILPHVLPDGKTALFTIWRGGSFNDNMIAAVDLISGNFHTVMNGGTGGRYVSTGHMVYLLGSTLMAVPFDTKSVKVTGEPIPLVDNILLDASLIYPFFAISGSGSLAYVPGGVEFLPTEITLAEHGSTIRHITSPSASVGFPTFSPDGKALGVVLFGPDVQEGVYDLHSGVLTPLTFKGDNIRHVWLPDGLHMSYSSNVGGSYQIYTVATDGSSPPKKLFDQDGNPYPSSWSRDEKYLVYVAAGKETGTDVWLYSAEEAPSTRPLIATRANEVNPALSPDGRWLAYVSDESGENEVYVQPFPSMTGRWRVSSKGGDLPRWSRDGRRILFKRNDEILAAPLSVKNGESIAFGKEERLLTRPGLISFDLAPNGTTVAIAQTRRDAVVNQVNVVLHWTEELKGKFDSREAPTVR